MRDPSEMFGRLLCVHVCVSLGAIVWGLLDEPAAGAPPHKTETVAVEKEMMMMMKEKRPFSVEWRLKGKESSGGENRCASHHFG